MNRYGSIDYARKYSKDLLQKALTNLRNAVPNEKKREKLESLALFLVERRF